MKRSLLFTFTILVVTGLFGAVQINAARADNFSVLKQLPLVISNVQATSTKVASTIISWDTNKLSDSEVVYWKESLTKKLNKQHISSAANVLKHLIPLNGLEASTTYYYFVASEDVYGHSAKSSVQQFTTLTPLVITNVQATSTGETSAKITWDTNGTSSGSVTFWVTGSSSASTSSAYSTTTSTSHAVWLNQLKASTTYSYFITSVDLFGQTATSSVYQFTIEKYCSAGSFSRGACNGILAILKASASWGGSAVSSTPIDSIRAVLVYGLKNFNDPNNPFAIVASSSIGLGHRLPSGQTPTYDLDATNTPEFADFVSYMTNGIDEIIYIAATTNTADGTILSGSGGGNWESYLFNGTPDLQGKNIEFIRFIIEKNHPFSLPNGTGLEYAYTVEIWGE